MRHEDSKKLLNLFQSWADQVCKYSGVIEKLDANPCEKQSRGMFKFHVKFCPTFYIVSYLQCGQITGCRGICTEFPTRDTEDSCSATQNYLR